MRGVLDGAGGGVIKNAGSSGSGDELGVSSGEFGGSGKDPPRAWGLIGSEFTRVRDRLVSERSTLVEDAARVVRADARCGSTRYAGIKVHETGARGSTRESTRGRG
ncbi:hypothetical protein B0H10DRAFT_1945703 [Mycena sp. CBHHK59/15]|nr:hypothetical protein B0H10DRAFT_1945703 [Mycena sp. CBHHK59/15]